MRSQCQSCKELEVFGWNQNWIPKNTRSRSWIFLSDPNSGSPLESFLHRTPKFGIVIHFCWNGTISYETFMETKNSSCL